MKKMLFFSLVFFILFGCFSRSTKIGTVDESLPTLEIIFSFNSESYPWILGKKYPQMAIWVRDKESLESQTIFITERGGKNRWIGANAQPSALPVWYGISEDESKDIDSISGATPSGKSARVLWQIPEDIKGKEIEVFIEANVSFDYNEFFPKDADEGSPNYSGVNGQPSLIWKCTLDITETSQKVKPEIIGHGSILGESHEIYSDLDKITTAKNLFNYILVIYSSRKD